VTDAAGAVVQLEGDAALAQHGDVAGAAVELLLRAKELQGALHALVVCDARRGPQRAQAVAAVFSQTHHPLLVDGVARRGAVGERRERPAQEGQVDVRPDDERPVVHRQPLDRLQRYAGARPRRRITRRDFARVGEARLERRLGLAVDDRDLMAGERQLPRRGDADDAGAENQDPHGGCGMIRRSTSDSARSDCSSPVLRASPLRPA